ncbi:hypothetical protein PISMIDRAFT_672060 [Pisolithus microcarpus 441]|uniref:Uncharacterized protein n=1 Tax=Pisolithus microcarpus 441 TaxID=765257 RepID=A0A0C9ZTW6_9AGAM|nr:hypothetical protein PISMIDRAFT_672060 [Pisolithus microcarpus 441]
MDVSGAVKCEQYANHPKSSICSAERVRNAHHADFNFAVESSDDEYFELELE